MTDIPVKLQDMLNLDGALIEVVEAPELTLQTEVGTIKVPAEIRSSLKYAYDMEPPLHWAMYIDKWPIFDVRYRPHLIGLFLDRFRTRRLAYATADEWMLAFRGWANREMGYFNKLYLSASTLLPLDTVDFTRTVEDESHEDYSENGESSSSRENSEATTGVQKNKTRDVDSDFPQEMLAANTDYASGATDSIGQTDQNGTSEASESSQAADSRSHDRNNTHSSTTRETGRQTDTMSLLEKQRALILNVDEQVLESAESLFLAFFDREELEIEDRSYFGSYGRGYVW